ncbi:uncharacterized protein RCC_06469 [Ramularia collo-cygni]|uniref:Uncharacterized protein n=1 Tax=Ramularia collo-cygni TaxID=112498 RepID=A0A2D3UVB4_9PEZI|nr:uncharacterized protein RCC_06469 [Ramularia collo-cygni]CZT20611.1 uncharacterized protein RCC_06469 [Ramularia collo-cygni]
MGARLSQPRGPGGTTESSVPTRASPPPSPKRPFPRQINRRTIIAPAAAATMALLLFVYTRTSIRAAKANAQRHRDVDSGGEGLSLVNEHRRRHGLAKKIDGDGGGTVVELGREILGGARKGGGGSGAADDQTNRTEEEERAKVLKMRMARKGGDDAAK